MAITSTTAEPEWHLRQRRCRQRARGVFAVEAARRLLQAHHGEGMGRHTHGGRHAYRVCSCGAWLREVKQHCHASKMPALTWVKQVQNSTRPKTARSASGEAPTIEAALGEWITQPSGHLRQASARRQATDAADAAKAKAGSVVNSELIPKRVVTAGPLSPQVVATAA